MPMKTLTLNQVTCNRMHDVIAQLIANPCTLPLSTLSYCIAALTLNQVTSASEWMT